MVPKTSLKVDLPHCWKLLQITTINNTDCY